MLERVSRISSDCCWTSCTFCLTTEETEEFLATVMTLGTAAAYGATANPELIAVAILLAYYGTSAVVALLADQCVSFTTLYWPPMPTAGLYDC
jgi:predicted signal transduction protein with EAL and GGDEF domain